RKALDTMLDAAANKLLHAPTTRIKAMAGDPAVNDLVKAVHHLFDLAELARELEAKERARSAGPAPSAGEDRPPTTSAGEDRPPTTPASEDRPGPASGDGDVALAPAGADRETVGR